MNATSAGSPLPLSPVRRVGDLVFVSGQVGTDPSTGQLVAGGVAEQTKQVLANLDRALATVGLGAADVVKTTIFLADPADFAQVNAVYADHFPEPFPARSTVAVTLVVPGLLVEIEAVASAANAREARSL